MHARNQMKNSPLIDMSSHLCVSVLYVYGCNAITALLVSSRRTVDALTEPHVNA